MDPVIVSIDPMTIVFFLGLLAGVITTVLMIWAWVEDSRDSELSQHVDDIFRRYM